MSQIRSPWQRATTALDGSLLGLMRQGVARGQRLAAGRITVFSAAISVVPAPPNMSSINAAAIRAVTDGIGDQADRFHRGMKAQVALGGAIHRVLLASGAGQVADERVRVENEPRPLDRRFGQFPQAWTSDWAKPSA